MPLSPLQSKILQALAAQRDPESYVAGSAYLARQGARMSGDIFHDREDRVASAAEQDLTILRASGLEGYAKAGS